MPECRSAGCRSAGVPKCCERAARLHCSAWRDAQHAGTPALQHLSTPALRHPGTPALRHFAVLLQGPAVRRRRLGRLRRLLRLGERADDGASGCAFLDALAAAAGGPVLELGCGTGRIALPVGRSGTPMVGHRLCRPGCSCGRAPGCVARVWAAWCAWCAAISATCRFPMATSAW